MGFLTWWNNQPKDEQLSLLGDTSEPLVQQQRVDNAVTQKALQSEVHARGGDKLTSKIVNATITSNMLDCSVDQLYRETGGKRGNRATLPAEAQEALMTGDIIARHEIVGQDAHGHQQILDAADTGSRKARKLFPW
jgi:hypothetical protein